MKLSDYCKNYYAIINFEPIEGDVITTKMISVYKKYVINSELTEENIIKLKNLDKAMKKYIDDCIFRKDLDNIILNMEIPSDTRSILRILIDKIISFFNNYTEYTTRVIYVSRWI